jgi:hypothetical protein
MNGIDKDSLKEMSLQDMVRGLIDMVYNLHRENEQFFKDQPPICKKKFVQIKHVKIAGCIIIGSLILGGIIRWELGLKLIPFM